jgi:gluconolactonase
MFAKCVLVLAVSAAIYAADQQAVNPKNGVPPIGPFSPGIVEGNYLYVSGQGAKRPDGSLPASFEDQVRQTLENVRSVVEGAGLTMKNVVYTQVYLEDMTQFKAMNTIYAEYFRDVPPARATLGVAKLPGGTPVEINAVAVKDVSEKKAVAVIGYALDEPISAGILTKDRLFISALRAKAGADPETEVEAALDSVKAVVSAAGLTMGHVVFVNPYLTSKIPSKTMNALYAKRFEFGNTPARATIEVTSLPESSQIEFTAVAVRNLKQRLAVRPKNMAPSPTASPCVFAGDTLYCSAKSGFIPGEHGGIFTPSIDLQLRQTMRNLQDNLEEAGLSFRDVVATNVYLDDLAEFSSMNKLYATYFNGGVYPARTTVQQIAPVERSKKADDTYPGIEQISIVAVKPPAQTDGPGKFELQALSPKFWKLIDHKAKLWQMAKGFGFTEGPVWDRTGFLYVSDEEQNRIYRVYPDGRKESLIELGDPDGSTFDEQGRLIDCASVLRAIIRVSADGKYEVLADRYEGKRFNSPNDVVVGPDHALYFTDPTLDLVKGEKQEIPFQGVYRLDEKGDVRLLVKDMTQPNGLAFSPDGRHFYVDDSEQKNIRVFDFAAGSVSNERVFGDENEPGGVPDGMRLDVAGNLYVVGPRGIWIWDAEGHHLGTIVVPEQPANLGWGGKDYRTLYITAGKSVYAIRTKAVGFMPVGSK